MTAPDVVQKRNEWLENIDSYDADTLVFLDESGVNIDMTRRYGRAVGKARAVDKTPESTPTNTTILSSVRLNGDTAYTTYSGGTTGDVFVDYLENILIPTLHKGDIVIMDNLRSHHVKAVAEVLAKAEVKLLYLPPYSPDFNPIEKMWSKIKSIRNYSVALRNPQFLHKVEKWEGSEKNQRNVNIQEEKKVVC